jgi:LAS superfamily LD-carboxypeptidase LdcB
MNPGFFLFVISIGAATCSSFSGTKHKTEVTGQGQNTPSVAMSAEAPEEKLSSKGNEPELSMDYLMGKFEPATHPDFVAVDAKYASGGGYYLRKETYDAFVAMWQAAMDDGIKLVIISATRNFERQKQIWEAKWDGTRLIENGDNAAVKYPDPKTRALKILEYSSMPSTSRHHWGTDIDLNDLDNQTFEVGEGKRIYEWLSANAHKFGFCQPYTAKGEARPNGYNEEKWHWSYIPVSKKLTKMASEKLHNEMIGGFKGAEVAKEIGVVEKYVLGINQNCL